MVEKQRKQRNAKLFRFCICSLLALLLCVFLLPYISPQRAFADDTKITYTTALEDLQKDSSFNKDDYPNKDNDYSLQVIQIAESVNKELFVYVYQPALCKYATSINISTLGDTLEFTNYKLHFINSNATLYKYRVADFVVSSEATRYYTIPSIFRAFNTDYGDVAPSGDNTISEVSYAVGKKYTFTADSVTCIDIEYISITDKFVGFCRYVGGTKLSIYDGYGNCDAHFVAFSTDKKIDKLMNADVYFTCQAYSYSVANGTKYSDKVDKVANLSYTDRVEYSGWQFSKYSYSWDRIQTVSDFFATENTTNVYSCGLFDVSVQNTITDEGIANLKSKQWILRFYESQYNEITGIANFAKSYVIVGDVSILRLQYESEGQLYNLGVIDNKQSGTDDPINDQTESITWPNWLTKLLRILFWVLVAVLGIMILIPLAPYIIKFLIIVIKYLAIGLWYIIKYLALAIWYILKYIGLGIYWIFAWPFYLKK